MATFTLVALAVLFVALGGCTVVAVRRWNVAAVVNTLAASAVVVLSLVLVAETESAWTGGLVTTALPLWVAVAGILHSIGMLGWYESVWWWDHLTHTVSAALLTALVYASLIVAVDAGAVGALAPSAVPFATLAFVLLVGVFWELIELLARAVGERYDIEPVLVHYGWRDTAFDLCFDLVGAVVIVALDVRLFVGIATRFPALTGTALNWAGGLVAVGSIIIVLVLGVSEHHDAW